MILCPKCSNKTRVTDSREQHRSRACKSCGYRFKTKEAVLDGSESKHVKVPIEMYEAFSELIKQIKRQQITDAWLKLLKG